MTLGGKLYENLRREELTSCRIQLEAMETLGERG
jgi:hypothetical protein